MVLYKRKPVRIEPMDQDPDDDAMVWQINETGEVYGTYDEYLERMDFYKTKQFNCEISGRSGLTFFEALRSEAAGAQEVEQTFPEALKGPVLRKVQFKTTSRLDNLVDMVFDEFKDNFFPGETVVMTLSGGDRPHGIIRDKVTHSRDGVPYSRYMVSVNEPTPEDRFCEAQELSRDRKSFNKSVLRSFIKKTVTRDAWNGAPWLVRHNYANRYHIDTRVPLELSYDNKLQERKLLQAQKRASINGDEGTPMGTPGSGSSGPARLPDLKPEASKSHKKQHHTPGGTPGSSSAAKGHGKTNGHHVPVPGQFMHLPLPGNPFEAQMSIRNNHKGPVLMPPAEPAPPPPPPPKYPIEDLQVPRKKNGSVRPALRFLCRDPPVKAEESDQDQEKAEPYGNEIAMSSVGLLLETWDTLNVYCEIFNLDSFTFDDYVEAMCVASEEVAVELFDEIHCSVLKVIVNEDGRVQVSLPALGEGSEAESESDDEEEEEEASSREPTPEAKPLRATRSSLAKQEAERIAAEIAAADAEASIVHRADEVLEGYDWVAEAAKRAFEDGGWQMIMVGLLRQLSRNERRKAACDEVLSQLVPSSIPGPAADTVREQYARLDVNLRVQALQMICMLTYETKAFRAYMEECSEGMTQYRKDRIEWQRKRKAALEDFKTSHDKKRELDAQNNPNAETPTPKLEDEPADSDTKMTDPDETMDDADQDRADTDDDAGSRRPKRRMQEKSAERARREREEQERREREKAAAAAARAAGTKQAKQYAKILKEIATAEATIKNCEDEVAVIENDLRESDCPRTRVLGKDRFWNRYYWFERNGMPFGGLPTSSTAEADYASGRIWVQGPDDIEREGFIEVSDEMQAEYRARFGMTILDRKREEEGGTSVVTAHQWGYLSEPEQVDALLHWLDPRGLNEVKLKKELGNFKDRICTTMRNRRAYLGLDKDKDKGAKQEDDMEQEQEQNEGKKEKAVNGTPKKRTTRTRATVIPAASPEPEEPQYRCLKWTNLTAIGVSGHIHSRQPPPAPAPKKKGGKKREAAAEPEPSPARKTRRR